MNKGLKTVGSSGLFVILAFDLATGVDHGLGFFDCRAKAQRDVVDVFVFKANSSVLFQHPLDRFVVKRLLGGAPKDRD